jgi:chromosome transmission fidelity protein 4
MLVTARRITGSTTANGRGQKKDSTKQTTLFGLPAVPAPEKPEKRSRKKGGTAPAEGSGVPEPETADESQDVEMAENQDAGVPTSQAATVTAVDSQRESQVTEVIATQEGSPEPIDWPPSPPPMEPNPLDEICNN